MSFLDNVGKKLSATSQEAVQKTKDMAEIVKLNASVSEEEKKIAVLIQEIGIIIKGSYEAIEKDRLTAYISWKNGAVEIGEGVVSAPPEGSEELRQAIWGNEAYLEKLVEIKTCQEHIAGWQNQIKQLKGIGQCPACGSDVAFGAVFCSVCGGKLPENQRVAAENVKVCPNCGAVLNESFVYCTKCGNRL